jgi:predicted Zn-ribbon and HTH transcriptional regulator
MQADPIEEWRRLREHYSQLSDEELYELAFDFVDLTESAQQVLRDEMRSRGLDLPHTPSEAPKYAAGLIAPRVDADASQPNPANTNQAADTEPDLPHEYTWKTQLCECESTEQAWQIHQVLRQAGIESWVEQPGSRYSFGISYSRVMVAADQLENAIEIAARPIPKEIVEESEMESPEFEPPSCPKCGVGDPVLEGVDPVNSWRCEACGNQWIEAVSASDAAAPNEK